MPRKQRFKPSRKPKLTPADDNSTIPVTPHQAAPYAEPQLDDQPTRHDE
jgi:hypothetical protein